MTRFNGHLHGPKKGQPLNGNEAQACTSEALQKLWDPRLTEEKFRVRALGSELIAVL